MIVSSIVAIWLCSEWLYLLARINKVAAYSMGNDDSNTHNNDDNHSNDYY